MTEMANPADASPATELVGYRGRPVWLAMAVSRTDRPMILFGRSARGGGDGTKVRIRSELRTEAKRAASGKDGQTIAWGLPS